MYGYIYLTTNIVNGKFYIGKRVKREFDKQYIGSGVHLKSAISKYGRDKFTCIIIDTAQSKEELNNKERFYIEATEAKKYGYNIASGGDGGFTVRHKWSNSDKHKISESLKQTYKDAKSTGKQICRMGKVTSDETKSKIRTRLKSYYTSHKGPFTGKRLSESTKQLLHDINTNGKLSKPVGQYDTNGRLIRVYPSVAEASRVNNLNKHNIATCCRGVPHFNTVGGFVWKYIVNQ